MYGQDDPYGYPSQSALQRQKTSGGPYGMGDDAGNAAAIQKAMDDLQQMLDEQKRRMAEAQAQQGKSSSGGGGGGGLISKFTGGGGGGSYGGEGMGGF